MTAPHVAPPAGALTLALRAVRLRCPACGGRPVFTSWFRMCDNCPGCGIVFQRGERGYWLGSWFVNLMLMETVFTAWIIAVIWWQWPEPDWAFLQQSAAVVVVASPLAFFPWSRTLFLAFDFLVRPPVPDDYRSPGERTFPRRNRGASG